MRRRNLLLKVLAVVMAFTLAFPIVACNGHEFDNYRPITDVNNLEGRKIGVNLAWSADYLLSQRDDMILYRYDTTADMLLALCYKQLDAVAVDFITGKYILALSTGLRQVPENLTIEGYLAVAKPDGGALIEDFDKWLEGYKQTPEYQAWYERLLTFNGNNYVPQNLERTGTGKKILVATYLDNFPNSYVSTDGQMLGYDVEFITKFANDMNYEIDIIGTAETDLYSGVATGKYDMIFGGLSTLYKVEYEAAGYPVSESYVDLPVIFIEIEDPDNLGLSGFINVSEEDE